MKKLFALILALVLCVGMTVPAFAADSPYEQINIGMITFEAAYIETVTLNFEDPYDFDYLGPKAKTVNMLVIKPDSLITITDNNGDPISACQVGTYSYDSEKDVYTEGWASELYTGKAEKSLSIFTVPVLLQFGDYFLKLGDNTTSNNPAESVEPTEPTEPIVGSFTDVKVNDYYADAVKWAVESEITKGTSKTTFSPDQMCTNAQILTFMWRFENSEEPSTAPFENLTGSEYYAKSAVWAHEMNMVEGSVFNADEPCPRAMTVEYLWKMADSPNFDPSDKFTDVSPNASYAQAVAWALEEGITSGTSDTTFSPNDTCTRGQIVTFLYRTLKQ